MFDRKAYMKEYSKKYRKLPHAMEANRAKANKYYANHREMQKEKARKRSREIRYTVIEHYGGKCACCGESHIEFLSIDHISGNGGKHRKEIGINSGWRFYSWLIRNGFPAGYRVLCFNCNCSLGFFGYCPHGNIKIESVAKVFSLFDWSENEKDMEKRANIA